MSEEEVRAEQIGSRFARLSIDGKGQSAPQHAGEAADIAAKATECCGSEVFGLINSNSVNRPLLASAMDSSRRRALAGLRSRWSVSMRPSLYMYR